MCVGLLIWNITSNGFLSLFVISVENSYQRSSDAVQIGLQLLYIVLRCCFSTLVDCLITNVCHQYTDTVFKASEIATEVVLYQFATWDLFIKGARDMGLENDADLKKLQEELRRERERVEKLEKEVKERMRQQLQNSGARRQGRWRGFDLTMPALNLAFLDRPHISQHISLDVSHPDPT